LTTTKLTLHGLQQFYVKLEEAQKNCKLNDLLDALEFNRGRLVKLPLSTDGYRGGPFCFNPGLIHGSLPSVVIFVTTARVAAAS
jgi:hypothetical protein